MITNIRFAENYKLLEDPGVTIHMDPTWNICTTSELWFHIWNKDIQLHLFIMSTF